MFDIFGIIFILISCILIFAFLNFFYKKNEISSDGIHFCGHTIFWSCKVTLLIDSILVNRDNQIDEFIFYSNVSSVKQYTLIKKIVFLKYLKDDKIKRLILQIDAPVRFIKELQKHCN